MNEWEILFTIIRPWEKTRTVAANNELMSVIENEFRLNKDDKFVWSLLIDYLEATMTKKFSEHGRIETK